VAGPFDRTIGGDFDADADADADLYADVGCGGEVVLPPRGPPALHAASAPAMSANTASRRMMTRTGTSPNAILFNTRWTVPGWRVNTHGRADADARPHW